MVSAKAGQMDGAAMKEKQMEEACGAGINSLLCS